MNIENVIHNETLTLKPIPPKILYCKTCNECRHKIRLQGKKHRKDYKQFILDLK